MPMTRQRMMNDRMKRGGGASPDEGLEGEEFTVGSGHLEKGAAAAASCRS